MVTSFDGSQNFGVCILVTQGTLVLVGKRKNAYKSGFYGLPGGRLEIGEPLEVCARRELEEETGVTAIKLEYRGVVREWQEDYDFLHIVFMCSRWDGEPKTTEPDKCEKWEWVDQAQLPSPMLAGHIAAVSLLHSGEGYKDISK